ncbi:DNA mismatch repair protein Msh3-like [Diadema antillarum]|uniref:DNA mismatch repair protein Msh3-like n=1 Tax=Diadema antillarum TaxID=105358 RepID=UPI003A873B4E
MYAICILKRGNVVKAEFKYFIVANFICLKLSHLFLVIVSFHSPESQPVSLSGSTLAKLNKFSLPSSSKASPDSFECGDAESSGESRHQNCNDPVVAPSVSEPAVASSSFSVPSKPASDCIVSKSVLSLETRTDGDDSRQTQSRKSAKLTELKDKFNYDTGSPPSSSSKHSSGGPGIGSVRARGRAPGAKSSLTPLEQQFVKIKENYQDAVLFVECGYRYRFFGEDAEIAAKELNIYCHLDRNFMTASIPTHRLFVHVRRLVAKGYKVGVVKQTETAALKAAGDNRSQPFERKLSALYTKSTLIGEDLEPSSHDCDRELEESAFSSSPTSYLLCLCEVAKEGVKSPKSDGVKFGLVAVQPATGDIVYDSFHDNKHLSELDTRMHHIRPIELLLPEHLSSETEKILKDIQMSDVTEDCIRVERLPNTVFEYTTAFEEVSSFYSIQEHSVNEIECRLNAVEEIIGSDSLQLKSVCDILAKTPDLDRGLCSIYHKKCSAAEFLNVVRSLAKLKLAFQTLEGSMHIKSALLQSVFSEIPCLLDGVESFLAAINEKAVREKNKTNLFTEPSQFPAVHQCMSDIRDVTDQFGDHLRRLRTEISMPSVEYVTVSGTEYMVEVKKTQLKRIPQNWVSVSSTKQVTRFRPPYVESSLKRLCQLREQLALECNNAWLDFLESFGEKYFSYRKAVQHLASFDCLLSLAAVSKQEGYCRPHVRDGPVKVEIKGGRHPVVSALKAEGEQYVPNDTSINVDGMRCMIITGPNMGGKSSYIKQVALISLMAQVGCYVPAESATVGTLDAIYTRMGASDDIFRNRSTFMSELQEASSILSQATPRSLVIMDELGRGTSTHDGVAIAYATALHLISEVKCLTLFVTHYPPLAELENLCPSLAGNFHMSFLLQETEDKENAVERLTFLYQLVEGVAARSYGLNVARLADIPEPILEEATRKSLDLENAVSNTKSTRKLFLRLMQTPVSSHLPLQQQLEQMFESIT